MGDYPPGYTGSLAAPPSHQPEKEDGFEMKPWEYWAEQQRKSLEWFDRIELEEK